MLSNARIDALLLGCLEGFQGQEGLEGQFVSAHSLSFTIETFVVYTGLNSERRPLGSVVEHSLHTRGVTSSNLVAGTKFFYHSQEPHQHHPRGNRSEENGRRRVVAQ